MSFSQPTFEISSSVFLLLQKKKNLTENGINFYEYLSTKYIFDNLIYSPVKYVVRPGVAMGSVQNIIISISFIVRYSNVQR